jgi:arylformamidase
VAQLQTGSSLKKAVGPRPPAADRNVYLTPSEAIRKTGAANVDAERLMMTSDPGAAGSTGAASTKGPLVWLDMDQKALDDAYDQSVYAPNAAHIAARREENNRRALAILGPPRRLAYGSHEIERVEVYRAPSAAAAVFAFIHGGAWRGGRAAQCAYMAEPFVRAGAHFVAVDFVNVLEAKGDLFAMADQVRRAVAWIYRNAESFGGDPERIFVGGHSSGAHLAGCVAAADWAAAGLSDIPIKGALLSSGMYDLQPVRLSKRSEYVAFTDEMVAALSPIRHLDKIRTPLVLSYGTLETPEFQRQTRDFHAALRVAGKSAELNVGTGYNHFEMQETLGNPYGLLGRAALSLMGLN